MTFSLDLRIDSKDVQQAIGDIRKKIEKPRPLMQEIGDIITEDIKHRIVNLKQSPDDVSWAPWAESTAKARERKGNAALGLLFDSGTLLRSITSQVIGSHHTLQVGTNSPYAEYIQFGTPKMPARPFMGISKRAQASINQAINMYFGDMK